MRSLADFLESLEEAGQLVRIPVEVDPIEELASLTGQVAANEGPALLFEKVRGHRLALASNLLGSESRICQALGVDDIVILQQRVMGLWQETAPAQGWLAKLRGGSAAEEMPAVQPRTVRSAACQQIVLLGSDVDLGEWPLITTSAEESGPALFGAVVFTVDPTSGVKHATLCDLQMVGPRQFVPAWHAYSPAAHDMALWATRAEPMPVAVMLGGDPTHAVAAATSLDIDCDITAWTSHLSQQALELVRCRTHDLEVPAEAELIVEGHIDPGSKHEAPCTAKSPTGYSRDLCGQPILEVAAITHRNGPILPTLTGGAANHNEMAVLGGVAARLYLPLLQRSLPEVLDIALPFGGVARSFATVSLKEGYAFHTRNVAGGLWSMPWLRGLKMLVLVDAAIDVHDTTAVLHAVATQVDPRRDMWIEDGPSHPLNHAAASPGIGSRVVVDATAKSTEECGYAWPSPAQASPETEELLRKRWSEYGLTELIPPPG